MKRWFVVQIYAGYENGIKADLLRRIDEKNAQSLFGEILIPSVEIQHTFNMIAPKEKRQLFPGYILIEMEPVPEAIRMVEATPRVVRLLGGKEPAPLSKKEVDRIQRQIQGEVALEPKESPFIVGGEVEISGGPFAGFMGVVERVDEENERLSVMVSIFGRMTPVELGFEQVKK